MKIIKNTKLLISILICIVSYFVVTFEGGNLNELQKSRKQEKLLIKKVQKLLRNRHKLHLILTGGSATSNRGKNLYKGFCFNHWEILSEKEVKKKFFLGLLEVLSAINTTKDLQEHLVVRPFTMQNLKFTVWSQVDRSDLEPELLRLYVICNDLGEITVEHKDLHYNPLQKKIQYADLLREFENEVPDYLKETAHQILDCPFVEKKELYKRYKYLWLNDESL